MGGVRSRRQSAGDTCFDGAFASMTCRSADRVGPSPPSIAPVCKVGRPEVRVPLGWHFRPMAPDWRSGNT